MDEKPLQLHPLVIVQLAGDWYDRDESDHLTGYPRLWVYANGQMWVQVAHEEAQQMHTLEHLSTAPLVLVSAVELFLISRDDFARQM